MITEEEARRRNLNVPRGLAWAVFICTPLWAVSFIVALLIWRATS